ncbi:MAG: DUF5700 domain-containing putative Zn-dependent protease [Promethearchaeota archaeon]
MATGLCDFRPLKRKPDNHGFSKQYGTTHCFVKVNRTLKIQVTVDASFAEVLLSFLEVYSERRFKALIQHPAAQRVHAHAIQWQNTDDDLKTFWTTIFEQERAKGPYYLQHVQDALRYVDAYSDQLTEVLGEIQGYLPLTTSIDCTLYLILGYDIGIVSQGDALLNLGHPLFQQDIRELAYFAMHEVHHVGFTQLHPFFSLDELLTLDDLGDAIQYSTQLEGLAVYAALRRRLNDQVLTHEDYTVLLDPLECEKRVQRFFDIYTNLRTTPNRPLVDRDLELFDIMSRSHQRLWYIAGAHMAREIDLQLGREMLLQTIIGGPESFFLTYDQLLDDL